MKKQVLMLMAALMMGSLAIHAVERVIPFEQLPQNAQVFTRTYFKAEDPLYRQAYVTYDPELFDSSYMVVFTNGDGLEFNKDGEWKDYECTQCFVPDEVIPATIQAYLSANMAGQRVKKIEKNRRSYDVKLDNGLELEFDLKGNLIELDD
ncbi:MAG: PepSY-like domain-containing protein [Paludibacteraceae bacterium]|nr:PepSY-like domain-containing protein [Paludibacteraceae bacterium]